MNQCKCKSDFSINNSSMGWDVTFTKDNWYQYITKKHEETGMIIYYVGEIKHELLDDEFLSSMSIPFVETKFNKLFDNIQQIREDKLNDLGI